MKISLKALTLVIAIVASYPAFSASMPTGPSTTIPIGHYEFCQRYPGECRAVSGSKAPVVYSAELMRKIAIINHEVNNAFNPKLDREIYGKDEYWEYPTTSADCEDYALEKRRRLIKELGISPANLLLTVIFRIRQNEAHAVLTLRTNKGDYILDNLNDHVAHWTTLRNYRFAKRQSIMHSARWVDITPQFDNSATALVE